MTALVSPRLSPGTGPQLSVCAHRAHSVGTLSGLMLRASLSAVRALGAWGAPLRM